jgi:uncharacterized protein (DUF486 family)
MRTITLLAVSNIFMTFAWYYHLKQEGWPLWKAIVISWFIALVEYCLAVPANRFGHMSGFTLFQLKIIQEIITLVIFGIFAVMVMNEAFHWRYLVSFGLLIGAAYFMFTKRFG